MPARSSTPTSPKPGATAPSSATAATKTVSSAMRSNSRCRRRELASCSPKPATSHYELHLSPHPTDRCFRPARSHQPPAALTLSDITVLLSRTGAGRRGRDIGVAQSAAAGFRDQSAGGIGREAHRHRPRGHDPDDHRRHEPDVTGFRHPQSPVGRGCLGDDGSVGSPHQV
jgi:hypothetical protein